VTHDDRDMAAQPWDRAPGESDDSYARFLYYRNAGVRRSFRKAYRQYLADGDGYTGGVRGLHVPGSWFRDSKEYFWVERVGAWDVRNLSAYGARVAALHAEAIAQIARKNLRAAGRSAPGEDDWQDLMASMRVVAAFLSPEVVKGVQDRFKPALPAPAAAGTGGDEADPDAV
jgi:hypothetical protein